MPEDVAPEETLDTPNTTESSDPASSGAPATESTDSKPPETNWEERYQHLQPEYTRATQEAAQLRQIIELAQSGDREAIEWLGLQLEDEDDDISDEPDYRDPRVDQLLQAEAERQQNAELDQLESRVESEVEQLAKSAGLDLTDDEVDLIFGALAPGADGQPDVAQAFKKVTGLREAHIESYRKSKKAPRVEVGAAGADKINMADDDERAQYFASLLEAGEA